MRLTLIFPCVGRYAGDRSYIRSWQMEPLAIALLADLTPDDIELRFYDDRVEAIPFDEPTDMVAISIETYTARRSYQIAAEYRERGVPVVAGGFHATLCPNEVACYVDAVIVGEAENQWAEVIDDARYGTLNTFYRSDGRPDLRDTRFDRSIFGNKRYMPVRLIEAGRGCHFVCDFCAVQSYYDASHKRRPLEAILREIHDTRKETKLYFFVDDNITSSFDEAKEFFRQLAAYDVKWVSQASINAAHDEEFLELITQAGCQALLIGFESLEKEKLRAMNKQFNSMRGGYEVAMANLDRYRVSLYATFIFGYDGDTAETFDQALEFACRHRFFMAAFNHLLPLPGTPLYNRLQRENRLLYDAWWLNPGYRFNTIPFRPNPLEPAELKRLCNDARKRFYAAGSIVRRFTNPVNRSNAFMARNFALINLMMRHEVRQRNELPLGDLGWRGSLPLAESITSGARP